MTQQNSALVEETSAASEAMQEQAAMLAQAVAVFRLEVAAAPPIAPVPARARPAPAPTKAPAACTGLAAAMPSASDWEEF